MIFCYCSILFDKSFLFLSPPQRKRRKKDSTVFLKINWKIYLLISTVKYYWCPQNAKYFLVHYQNITFFSPLFSIYLLLFQLCTLFLLASYFVLVLDVGSWLLFYIASHIVITLSNVSTAIADTDWESGSTIAIAIVERAITKEIGIKKRSKELIP